MSETLRWESKNSKIDETFSVSEPITLGSVGITSPNSSTCVHILAAGTTKIWEGRKLHALSTQPPWPMLATPLIPVLNIRHCAGGGFHRNPRTPWLRRDSRSNAKCCWMQRMDDNETATTYYTKARLIVPYSRLSCTMPLSPRQADSTQPYYSYSIAVSNNNETFSETRPLFIYDSKCLDCTGHYAESCTLKVTDFQFILHLAYEIIACHISVVPEEYRSCNRRFQTFPFCS